MEAYRSNGGVGAEQTASSMARCRSLYVAVRRRCALCVDLNASAAYVADSHQPHLRAWLAIT
eukprot:353643-Chlamydomonas_euryale.AAC.7